MKRLLLSAALFGISATAFAGSAYAWTCTPGQLPSCDFSQAIPAQTAVVVTWNYKPLRGYTLAVPSGNTECWVEDDRATNGPAAQNGPGFPFGVVNGAYPTQAYTSPDNYTPVGGLSVWCQQATWLEIRAY